MIKILVVDDEPDLEVLIKQKFRKKIREQVYEFVFAVNGNHALKQLEEHNDVDIVLSDINMPEMDGYEATRLLKSEQPNLPIIAQTAYAMADEEQKSYEAGCDGYITKPINFTQLLNMMEDLLDKK